MRLKGSFAAVLLSLLFLQVSSASSVGSDFGSTALDVPFVPTREAVVEAMLRMGQVGEQDLLYDLGSGDGRIVIAAAKEHGAHGVGVDLDPQRVREAKANARSAGVEDKVEFIEGDIFKTDFSRATVVTMYLLPAVNLKLRPRILEELKPGTRVVSHAFDMGEWQPDQKEQVGGSYVYMWIVPAPVAGTWQWQGTDGSGYQVELEQDFQQLSGQAWIDGKPAQVEMAELQGDQLRLSILADGADAPVSVSARYADGRLVEAPDAGQSTATAEPVVWERVQRSAG